MRRTKAEAAETRAAILVAAEKLFFEKGVANSTLDEIASAAGVTRGAIYWHFESKSDLFLQLYNSVQLPRVNMSDVDTPDCDDRDALASVEKMAYDWLETLSNDPQRQRLLTILLRTNFTDEFKPVLIELEKLDEEHTQNIERILGKAVRNSRLASNWTPQLASHAIKWQIKGICWEWLLFGQKFDLAGHGQQSLAALFATFRAI